MKKIDIWVLESRRKKMAFANEEAYNAYILDAAEAAAVRHGEEFDPEYAFQTLDSADGFSKYGKKTVEFCPEEENDYFGEAALQNEYRPMY